MTFIKRNYDFALLVTICGTILTVHVYMNQRYRWQSYSKFIFLIIPVLVWVKLRPVFFNISLRWLFSFRIWAVSSSYSCIVLFTVSKISFTATVSLSYKNEVRSCNLDILSFYLSNYSYHEIKKCKRELRRRTTYNTAVSQTALFWIFRALKRARERSTWSKETNDLL